MILEALFTMLIGFVLLYILGYIIIIANDGIREFGSPIAYVRHLSKNLLLFLSILVILYGVGYIGISVLKMIF